MNILYLTHESNEEAQADALIVKAKAKGYPIDKLIIDQESNRINWTQRDLYEIVKNASTQLTIVTDDASHLARSTLQILEIFENVAKKKANVYFIDYDYKFIADANYTTVEFLQIIQRIETEFVAKRTTDALARRRAAGLPLGRPKGRKNKNRKLDAHRTDIKRYLTLNLSKASIAKLVGCHAQTLYNYIEATHVCEEIEKERHQETTYTSA